MSYSDDIKSVASLNLPWEILDGCNILITGATGLIGSCLVEVLMARRNKTYHIYVSGRSEEHLKQRFNHFINDSSFHFIQYDVMFPLKSNVTFHYVIHAASNASPNYFVAKPVEIIKSNINGVANLLDYGLHHGVKRLLYVSTGEVYGEGDGRVFTEEYSGYVDCTKPRSCYPSAKRAAETLCVSYGAEYGIDTVIARPCHIYGPGFTSSDNRVYAQFIRNILNNEDIIMKSTGEQYRSWCYVVDCISAMLFILLKGKSGEAYNIADSTSNITIRELAEMIAILGNKKVITDIPSSCEKAGYNVVKQSVFSTAKLEELGWSVNGTMNEKIKKTIQEVVL